MNVQQRLFDGYTVTHERGTLSSFQIEDEDIQHFRADDVVVLVATGTIGGASYKHDASGDWVRTNKLTTHEVRVATGVMREEIVEFYNLAGDQLPFVSSGSSGPAQGRPTSAGSTHVDPSVASGGNTSDDSDEEDEEEEDTQDDQDFSPPDQAARDKVLASFLNEQSA